MSKQTTNNRHTLICLVFIVCLCGIIAKLLSLSYSQNKFLERQANSQYTRSKDERGSRGELLDRNNLPLAISVPVSDLVLDPKVILESKKYSKIIQTISNINGLDINKKDLVLKIKQKPKSRYLRIAKELLPTISKPIKDKRLPGVHLINYERTFYPGGNSSAQLVGFTDENNKGQAALEKKYNSILTPTDGKQTLITNAKGNTLSIIKVNKQEV